MPLQFLTLIFVLLSFILPAWILYRLLLASTRKGNGKNPVLKKEIFLVVFIIYISIVLAATIVPAPFLSYDNPRDPGLNFIPVINTYNHLVGTLSEPDGKQTRFALDNIIGNIILFIPLGIFLPFLSTKFRSIKIVAVFCFLSSMSIEATQLLMRHFNTYRMVDIDDIILNTLGGIMGWLIFSKFLIRIKSNSNHISND